MIEKSESADKSVDPVRLAAVYAEHGTGLRRLAFGVLHDWQAAEDVVQAAFAKAAQSAGDVRPEAIKSWLHRVAFHEAITWKRRLGVDRKAVQQLGPITAQASETPEESFIRRETVERVRQAMQDLSPRQRQVIRARIYEGKTFAQIADEMDAPLGTVLTHMRRGLEKLREALQRKE